MSTRAPDEPAPTQTDRAVTESVSVPTPRWPAGAEQRVPTPPWTPAGPMVEAPTEARSDTVSPRVWIPLVLLLAVLLIAGTVGATLLITGRTTQSSGTASGPTATVPFAPRVVAMPNYTGWTMQGAVSNLDSLGLNVTLSSTSDPNAIIVAQSPAPGTQVSATTTTGIRLYTSAPSPDFTPASPAAPAAPVDSVSAGTYEVGDQIQPGTYSTGGGSFCYWARLKAADGELDSIIANSIVQGPGTMTIKSSDKYVELSGDCTWTKK
jgi:hypothetical protein